MWCSIHSAPHFQELPTPEAKKTLKDMAALHFFPLEGLLYTQE